jgi:lysophospholipase L1-like esterase
MKVAAVLVGVAASLLLVEITCRWYSHRIYQVLDHLKQRIDHYYQPSSNPVLVYELRPDYEYAWIGRRLYINKHGIRDDSSDLALERQRVALLGDSTVFGIWQTQDVTISSQAQRMLDAEPPAAKVLNLGVPGYAIAEIAELFRVKNAVYSFHEAVYILNPNDFARRDSIYEGADNGLYRMYRRPVFHTPHFARKAVYRLKKHGALGSSAKVSDEWYRWLFEGNRDFARRRLEAMVSYAQQRGIRFSAILLPAGSAFGPAGEYRLADLNRRIGALLDDVGIEHFDATAVFAQDPVGLMNETEHPTIEGNKKLAAAIVGWLRDRAVPDAVRSRESTKASAP